MRVGRLAVAAVAAVAAAAVLAACTGEDDPQVPTVGGNPTTTVDAADPGEQELAFVACMRDAGIEDMPDPVPGDTSGRSSVRYALDVMGKGSDQSFQAALEECMDLLPPPPAPEPRSSDEVEALHQFARCMRDHGLAEFPDPRGDSALLEFIFGHANEPMPAVTMIEEIAVVNLNDPVAAAAWEACRPLHPASSDEGTAGQ